MNTKTCGLLLGVLTLLTVSMISCHTRGECSEFIAEDARWAADQNSPDFRHLGVTSSSQPFTLEVSHLEQLSQLNHFDVTEGQDEILFGLRGCQIVNGNANSFSEAVELQESAPDHQNYLDVLGVWKRSTGEVAVFSGSTVPNWEYMCLQAEEGGHKANMLPTGRYIYQVGRHQSIEGAFRLKAEVVVLRSNDNLVYETTDLWEKWVPLDNIHPGGCPGKMFSSAGCQTIPGTFEKECAGIYDAVEDMHLGYWSDFRQRAGLDPDNNKDKWDSPYVYLLLTCREARLVSSLVNPASLTRLRFGSSGSAVEELQAALNNLGYSVPLTGQMDPETTITYIQWQQTQGNGAADGIVTPEIAESFGFELGQ